MQVEIVEIGALDMLYCGEIPDGDIDENNLFTTQGSQTPGYIYCEPVSVAR